MPHDSEIIKPQASEFLDEITLLRASHKIGKQIAFENGSWHKRDLPHGFAWTVERVGFNSLEDLAAALKKAASDCRTILIHGEPANGIDWNDALRRNNQFVERPVRFIAIDIDSFETSASDVTECAATARGMLPPEFRSAACIAYASAGHWLTEGRARLRLVFLAARALTLAEIDALVSRSELPCDRSIYRSVQPIFLSTSVAGGQKDPIAKRWVILPGEDFVQVPDEIEVVSKTKDKRGKKAPANMLANDPQMIMRALDQLSARKTERVERDGRRNSFRAAALDMHDCAVTEDLAEQIIATWFEPDEDNFELLLEALLEDVDETEAMDIITRLRGICARLSDSARSGEDALDRSHVFKQIADAYRGAENEFGCNYQSAEEIEAERVKKTEMLGSVNDNDPGEKSVLRYSGDLVEEWKPTSWIVKKLLPATGIALLIGDSHIGKSWLLIDWLNRVSRGMSVAGMKTRKGGAIYLAGEGEQGIVGRFKAWELHHGKRNGRVHIAVGLDLFGDGLNETQERRNARNAAEAKLKEVVAAYRAENDVDRIVIAVDTLASVSPGLDENNNVAVKNAFAVMRRLERKLKVLFVVVHHTPLSAPGRARGSSVFRGNADVQIVLTSDLDSRANAKPDSLHFYMDKQRDGERLDKIKLRLKGGIVLGVDEDGDEVTSAVMTYRNETEVSLAADDQEEPADLGDGPEVPPEAAATAGEPQLDEAERVILELARGLGRPFTAEEITHTFNKEARRTKGKLCSSATILRRLKTLQRNDLVDRTEAANAKLRRWFVIGQPDEAAEAPTNVIAIETRETRLLELAQAANEISVIGAPFTVADLRRDVDTVRAGRGQAPMIEADFAEAYRAGSARGLFDSESTKVRRKAR